MAAKAALLGAVAVLLAGCGVARDTRRIVTVDLARLEEITVAAERKGVKANTSLKTMSSSCPGFCISIRANIGMLSPGISQRLSRSLSVKSTNRLPQKAPSRGFLAESR